MKAKLKSGIQKNKKKIKGNTLVKTLPGKPRRSGRPVAKLTRTTAGLT